MQTPLKSNTNNNKHSKHKIILLSNMLRQTVKRVTFFSLRTYYRRLYWSCEGPTIVMSIYLLLAFLSFLNHPQCHLQSLYNTTNEDNTLQKCTPIAFLGTLCLTLEQCCIYTRTADYQHLLMMGLYVSETDNSIMP